MPEERWAEEARGLLKGGARSSLPDRFFGGTYGVIPHFDSRDLSSLSAAKRTSLTRVAGNNSDPQILELINLVGSWVMLAPLKASFLQATLAAPKSYSALQNEYICCLAASLKPAAMARTDFSLLTLQS